MENTCLCASESRFCIRGLSPVYRVKFYELLNRASDISYVVFHGVPPSDTGYHEVHQRFNFPNVRVVNRVVSLCGYRAIYQPVIKQIVSTAMVIPEKVGLVVNHAFAHGVPVITRCHNLHAPEVEYIEPGQNGLVIPGHFDGFVQTVADCLNGGHHVHMSAAALKTRERLTLDYMVQTFHEAVSTTLAERRVSQE
jgi:hypothetical protein